MILRVRDADGNVQEILALRGEKGDDSVDVLLRDEIRADTLMWDGNTEGLPSYDMMGDGSQLYYKVSANVVTLEELASGVTIETITGDDVDKVTLTDFAEMGDHVYASPSLAVLLFVTQDNVPFYGDTIPEKGIYFWRGAAEYVSRIKISGYTGFDTRVKVIKDVYIPDNLRDGYVSKEDYATDDTAGVVYTNSAAGIDARYGVLRIVNAPESAISQKASAYLPIVPKTIDQAVYVGITTNTKTLTNAEKTTACAWLGAAEKSHMEALEARIAKLEGTT